MCNQYDGNDNLRQKTDKVRNPGATAKNLCYNPDRQETSTGLCVSLDSKDNDLDRSVRNGERKLVSAARHACLPAAYAGR